MLGEALMGTHEQSVGATDEWYTPAYIFEAMCLTFDLDPAHPGRDDLPVDRWLQPEGRTWWGKPYLTTRGLDLEWSGRVWLNPPFGARNGIVPWLERFVAHEGGGVAFVPDRTSAPWWQRFAPQADSLLFISPKVKMLSPAGLAPSGSPAQGTTLLARGMASVEALQRAEAAGLGKVWRR
jgi:hypothetical protein